MASNKDFKIDLNIGLKIDEEQERKVQEEIEKNHSAYLNSLEQEARDAEVKRLTREKILTLNKENIKLMQDQLRNAPMTKETIALLGQASQLEKNLTKEIAELHVETIAEAEKRIKEEEKERQEQSKLQELELQNIRKRRKEYFNSFGKLSKTIDSQLDKLTGQFGLESLSKTVDNWQKLAKDYGAGHATAITALQTIGDVLNKAAQTITKVFERLESAASIAGFGANYGTVYSNMTGQLNSGVDQATYYAMKQMNIGSTDQLFQMQGFLSGTAAGDQMQKDLERYIKEYNDMFDSGYFEQLQEFQVARAEVQREFEKAMVDVVMQNMPLIKNILSSLPTILPPLLKATTVIAEGVAAIAGWLFDYKPNVSSSDLITNYNSNATNITFNNQFSGDNAGSIASDFNTNIISNLQGGQAK